MKKAALATLLVTLSVGAAYAAAPSPATPPAAAPGAAAAPGGAVGVTQGDVEARQNSFTLVQADVIKLKDWITAQKTASVAAPSGFTVAAGSTVPMNIMLIAIPASAGVNVGSNLVAVIDNKIVLVNPTDRKVVLVVS